MQLLSIFSLGLFLAFITGHPAAVSTFDNQGKDHRLADSSVSKSNKDTLKVKDYSQTGWKSMKLKEKIKCIKETDYNVKMEVLQTFGEIQPSTRSGSAVYNFNPSGNFTECHYFEGNGRIRLKSIYHYDDLGRLTNKNTYDRKGNLKNVFSLSYDSEGEVADTIVLNSLGLVEETTVSQKNANGNQPRNFVPKHDAFGNEIESYSFKKNGDVLYRFTYKYDQYNNIIEVTCFELNGSPVFKFAFSYKYDKTGNWTKRITYRMDLSNSPHKNNLPTKITYREIEYY
jgi:hypothetical protein